MTPTTAADRPVYLYTVPAGDVAYCHEHGRITIPTDRMRAEMAAEVHELTEHQGWV